MAPLSVLLSIVRNGNDLHLTRPLPPEHLVQLAKEASLSGAKLSVTTQLPERTINELLKLGKDISFVDDHVSGGPIYM